MKNKDMDKVFFFGALLILITHLIGVFMGIPDDQQQIHAILNIIAAFMILVSRVGSADSLANFFYGLGFILVFITHVLMLLNGVPQTNITDHNLFNLLAYLMIVLSRNRMVRTRIKIK